jgi:HAD superfamily hydrolase (TIGR01509 family)
MRSASAARFDAVTVDAFGTVLLLDDPAEPLRRALRDHGVAREVALVRDAFRAEAAYYRPRSLAGRDAASLETLRRECVRVFLQRLAADLDPAAFAPAFMAAIRFRLSDGADEALDALAAAGLSLACVANWDVSLHEHLARAGVAGRFQAVVTSAEAGVEKPDPGIFRLALGRLGVEASRALHIGDEDVDRAGAAAAGLAFEPVPLATLPERLGL